MPRSAEPSPELLERSRQFARDCLGIMGQPPSDDVVEAMASKVAGNMARTLWEVSRSERRIRRAAR